MSAKAGHLVHVTLEPSRRWWQLRRRWKVAVYLDGQEIFGAAPIVGPYTLECWVADKSWAAPVVSDVATYVRALTGERISAKHRDAES